MINIREFLLARFSKEPEQSFGGVSLSSLSKLAKSIDCRNYCTIDKYGFLVLHHYDLGGMGDRFQTQFTLDDNMRLILLNGLSYIEGGYLSQTGKFAKAVNSTLEFTCHNK